MFAASICRITAQPQGAFAYSYRTGPRGALTPRVARRATVRCTLPAPPALSGDSVTRIRRDHPDTMESGRHERPDLDRSGSRVPSVISAWVLRPPRTPRLSTTAVVHRLQWLRPVPGSPRLRWRIVRVARALRTRLINAGEARSRSCALQVAPRRRCSNPRTGNRGLLLSLIARDQRFVVGICALRTAY